MSNEFYDPVLQLAGPLAEEYGVSISDVMSLLALAGKDESLVRRALEESMHSAGAVSARSKGRSFDLVAQARVVLQALRSRTEQQ